MKKLLTSLLFCVLLAAPAVIFSGCAAPLKFTTEGAQIANTFVTRAMQLLSVVQVITPGLEAMVSIPSFVNEALPYLTMARTLETSLHNFIDTNTDKPETTDQAVQIDAIAQQVEQVQTGTAPLVTKLAKMTKALQAENIKLKAIK